MKKTLPMIVLTGCGIIMAASFYLRGEPLNKLGTGLLTWGVIVAAFSLGLGAVNLVQLHLNNVSSGKNVVYSVATIASFFVMALLGIASSQKGDAYTFLFKNMLQPLGDTVFALLAFYVATATYRAFRVRNIATGVLLASALIMLLGNTPMIGLVSEKIPVLANWVLTTPTVAARRGITVCAAVGALAAAIRAFTGLESRLNR